MLKLGITVSHGCTFFFFFFNDPAPTEIYPLSLHDALPISQVDRTPDAVALASGAARLTYRELDRRASRLAHRLRDRKSTRLNSSHLVISYAVFCLKKKKTTQTWYRTRTI